MTICPHQAKTGHSGRFVFHPSLLVNKFKHNITPYLANNENIFFYWKGRVALYAILKAMNVGRGDEVILPAFTCVVVPNAILYCGAKPVYVDVDSRTFNINVGKIEEKITSKTKAILCQNTFGLSPDLDAIATLAAKHGVYTIEDCTHGFGGTYKKRPNGTSCDASFFSTQWNKPFSTGLGGFSLINNPALRTKVKALEEEKVPPSTKELVSLRLQTLARKFMLNDFLYWKAVRLYRWLARHNLVLGSSSGQEITSCIMPDSFFKGMSDFQAREGVRSLKDFDALNGLRKRNARAYTDFLKQHGKTYVSEELFADHLFLKYPIRVNCRDDFMDLAEQQCIPLGDWFLSPIHPVKDGFDAWALNVDEYPVARIVSSQIVNLPTDTKDVEKVIEFLGKKLEFVL